MSALARIDRQGIPCIPGETQFTRISLFSLAAVRDSPITAALLAQYGETPGAPI